MRGSNKWNRARKCNDQARNVTRARGSANEVVVIIGLIFF